MPSCARTLCVILRQSREDIEPVCQPEVTQTHALHPPKPLNHQRIPILYLRTQVLQGSLSQNDSNEQHDATCEGRKTVSHPRATKLSAFWTLVSIGFSVSQISRIASSLKYLLQLQTRQKMDCRMLVSASSPVTIIDAHQSRIVQWSVVPQ